jgi:hypothetical protein
MNDSDLSDILKKANYDEGHNDFQSLITAVKILEVITKIVRDSPKGSETEVDGDSYKIDVEKFTECDGLWPYIVNVIDDTINVTHEEISHMVTVQFAEKAYWKIEYNNWGNPEIGATTIAMGDLGNINGCLPVPD